MGDVLRFVTCGSVDSGKSTLVGHLLHETNQISEGELAGLPLDPGTCGSVDQELDFASLLGGFPAERKPAITIDVAYRFFSTPTRKFIVADPPGHEQYTRNMASAASTAQLAVVLVDARKGVTTQTRRHSRIVSMLGIRHIVLAVNKMDAVAWSHSVFEQIRSEYSTFAVTLELESVVAIPISALTGANITTHADEMPWHEGLPLLAHLNGIEIRERGETDAAAASDQFEAKLLWMTARPLVPGRPYLLKIHAEEVGARVTAIKYLIDIDTGAHLAAKQLSLNDIGVVNVSLDRTVAFSPYAESTRLGAFIFMDRLTNETAGAGVIDFPLRRASNIRWQKLSVDPHVRARIKNQTPRCIWLTGLSGSGKSTIANLLEKKLHDEGLHTFLLDGDNVRHGLNRDLGFTEADRVENLRRVAEVAKLMVQAGLVVIVAFISPYRAERAFARSLFTEWEFFEVYVDTPLAECERRDPKGLYAKARAGDLINFTGIDSPYEAPENPEIRLRTVGVQPVECAEALYTLIGRWR